MSRILADPDQVPPWLRQLVRDPARADRMLNRRRSVRIAKAVVRGNRRAAVLVLFSGDPTATELPPDADVLLTVRASTLRNHSGQIAFPGGGEDRGDDYPVGTALREAVEETGLDAAGVLPLAVLDPIPTTPSSFVVEPVIAYWTEPSEVRVVDPGETALVARLPLKQLLAPENRFQVTLKVLGGRVFKGPAFFVDRLLVWGLTGGILDAVCAGAGWEIDWDRSDVRDLGKALSLAVNK